MRDQKGNQLVSLLVTMFEAGVIVGSLSADAPSDRTDLMPLRSRLAGQLQLQVAERQNREDED